MEINRIVQGDALTELKKLPNESINCCMTSPPYWALRDYGVEGQLGLEPTFQEYINKLCDIFDEVKRVLRKDGTCWVNMGDTYSATRWTNNEDSGQPMNNFKDGHRGINPEKITGLEDKNLTLVPFHFAIEMQNRGWILRNVIIWHKPNCMPCSVKDRFTVDFEYLFFFVKSKTYWFETQYENVKKETLERNKYGEDGEGKGIYAVGRLREAGSFMSEQGRNKRTTWTITTKPFKEAHFATYPEALCETPIKAGCPIRGIVLDPFFGAGTTGLVALKQNKQFIGIELNPEYIKIAEARLKPYLEQKKL
jgi:DNA modification methylase